MSYLLTVASISLIEATINRSWTLKSNRNAYSADKNGKRAGTNTLLKRTLSDPAKFNLTVQLETLVTRIIINWEDAKPSATGVEVLRGSHQYEVS